MSNFFRVDRLPTDKVEGLVMWIGEVLTDVDEGDDTDTWGGLAIAIIDFRPVLITSMRRCNDSLVLNGYEEMLSGVWPGDTRRVVDGAEMTREIDRRCADVIVKCVALRIES